MTASASRLGPRFAALQAAPRAALVSFVTAGDPSPEHTVPAMHALVKGGTDILELGIPFSDPEAEGPAIQASSERALAQGMTLKQVLDLVATFRLDDRDTPIVLMGYLNSILAMADFAARAEQAGVDGLIMVNLPPEEGDGLQAELRQHHIDLIFLLAPTTTAARAEKIMQRASGFIYYVSLKGITGADHLQTDVVAARLAELREQTDTPVCVGVGIKD
ncbi:MAG TPA: tryptophan synthase subunit alpha, partial [Gammaproteobacteria bacterium]|nr:tryptophan synthase subunit alpha [Gammaproteobacteria bacterium]